MEWLAAITFSEQQTVLMIRYRICTQAFLVHLQQLLFFILWRRVNEVCGDCRETLDSEQLRPVIMELVQLTLSWGISLQISDWTY
jgi:hypothetical protein